MTLHRVGILAQQSLAKGTAPDQCMVLTEECLRCVAARMSHLHSAAELNLSKLAIWAQGCKGLVHPCNPVPIAPSLTDSAQSLTLASQPFA